MTDPTENRAQSRARSMAQRYGTERRRGRRVGIVLGGLLAAALLAWAVWAAGSQDQPPIEADVTSYDVVGTHEIRVKVAAHVRDAETDGSCLVRATAEDHTIVGERNLTTDELRATRGRWITIRTERRATTATLVRCSD